MNIFRNYIFCNYCGWFFCIRVGGNFIGVLWYFVLVVSCFVCGMDVLFGINIFGVFWCDMIILLSFLVMFFLDGWLNDGSLNLLKCLFVLV